MAIFFDVIGDRVERGKESLPAQSRRAGGGRGTHDAPD
jgi:hypothetical protein